MSQIDGSAVASLRRLNATKVLDVLRGEPYRKFTVHEMAVSTGLSRPTVGRLLEDFASSGWALIAEGVPGATGRPARRFSFDRNRGLIVSIDIGRQGCIVLVSDLVGNELAISDEFGLDMRDPNFAISHALDAVSTVLDTLDDAPEVLGVCFAAPVALSESGVVLHSRTVPEWVRADFGARLRAAYPGRPLVMNNDLFIMAEAELRLGALRDAQQGMYVYTGTFTTVALTINGKVHRGFRQLAGEIGSLEEYRWQDQLDAAMEKVAPGLTKPTSFLVSEAELGKTAPREAISVLAHGVSPGIVDLASVWDPDVVVLGGSLSRSDQFYQPIEAALQEFSGGAITLRREQMDSLRAAAYGGIHRVLESIDWSA
ncbi:ROK family protein [Galactobacter caseinivorans]|uniref:ROK family protein n=1 Tax=Galactobacter caseinivorans TaxID=2676123 RepID=UPI001314A5FB|nr:ROK family protein [Galactobacter caseinivorans]